MTTDCSAPLFDGLARDIFDGYPAPTLIVDDDVRVLALNRAARAMLGDQDEATPLLLKLVGEALHCVNSEGPGGCGRHQACRDCIIRGSVRQALASGVVHRARSLMQLRGHGSDAEACVLVSASPVEHQGTTRVVLTLENVSDVPLADEFIRSERALREAHERAASLARFPEENPDPVLRLGSDLTLVYANEGARSQLGELGLHLGRAAPPPLADGGRRAIKEGNRVWSEVSCGGRVYSLSFAPAGAEVNVYAQDITAHKRAMEQLAAEKERLAVTLSSIGDAVITTDEAARITLVNGVTEELTGWKAAECISRPIHEVFRIISEETRQPAVNPVDRALREGVIVGLANHTALVARDGTELPIADSAAPIRDASGRTAGVVLVFRDQTKERRAEQALRDSEQRIRLKLESILSPEGDLGNLELADIIDAQALQSLMDELNKLARIPMAVVDVRGKVLVGVGWQDVCTRFHRAHPETCKHCVESDTQLSAGFSVGEIKLYKCKNNMWDVATPILVGGHHLGNVFMGQFFFDDEPLDYDVFRAQAARYGFDQAAYLAALEAVPRLSRESVAAAMAFFLGFAGMLSKSSYGNLKLARSAAERETLMASLQENKEQLEDADRRKNEFLAVLSHELRNPLAPIRNSLYLLDRVAPGTEQAERAKAVLKRQTDHLARLVDDLLDVTRISRGKITLNRAIVDARDVVMHTCEDHRSVFGQLGVNLRVELPAGPVWIDADATRLSQVLGNLLQNAAKFTPRHGSVIVTVATSGGRAELRVSDDGIGIEPELLAQVFEPFAQAERGLARTQGGLGLGLALVKGLVELHGGSVDAKSTGADRGSEFVVRLPLAADPEAARAEGRSRREGTMRSVLIIEDFLDSGQSLAEVIELYGHRVALATDGRSGVACAKELRPDVVLCDIGLPDVDGYQVARALRADDALRKTYLVALSGYAQPEDQRRAKEAGFDAHLAKPAPLDEILAILSNER